MLNWTAQSYLDTLHNCYLQGISILYSFPSTSVIYASHLSAPFPIFQGTGQGCPLTPILLATEPQAIALRDPNVTSIQYTGVHYKVSLFVDDTLLTLITLPNHQHLLSRFSALSGLWINPQKNTALNITLPPSTVSQPQTSFPFAENTSSLDYFGVELTLSYSSLFAANYYSLLKTLTSPMQ